MLLGGDSETSVSREELRSCLADLLESSLERLAEKHKEQLDNLCQNILGALAEKSHGLSHRQQDSIQKAVTRPSTIRFSAVSHEVLGRSDVPAGYFPRSSRIAEEGENHNMPEANEIKRCSESSRRSRHSTYSSLSADSVDCASEGMSFALVPDRPSGMTQVGMFATRKSSMRCSLSLADQAVRVSQRPLMSFDRRSRMSQINDKMIVKSANKLKQRMQSVRGQSCSKDSVQERASENYSDEVTRVGTAVSSLFSMRESTCSGGGVLAAVKNISSNPFADKDGFKEEKSIASVTSTLFSRSLGLPDNVVAKASSARHVLERHRTYLYCRACCGFILRFNRKLVSSTFFDYFSALVILAFMVLLGIQTNASSKSNGGTNETLEQASLIFNMWFIIELAMRIAAEGMNFFRNSPELSLNIMDTILVLTSVAELIFGSLDSTIVVYRVARVIRVLRAIRAVRLARVMQHVMQFRKMVYLIQGSLGTLFWCLLFLFLVIYVFAVLFTQGVTDHLRERQELEEEQLTGVDQLLKQYYGSMPQSISSLFQSMSNGMGWAGVFDSMVDMGWTYSAAFIAFIAFSMFGVLNVLTSVFVESTVQIAMTHRDIIQHDHERHMEIAIKHLREVFNALDYDGTGSMNKNEVTNFLLDPLVHAYLEALDINLHDSATLFKLLDADGTGDIDIDEFCRGCLKLKGTAKSFDLHCLINEISRFLDKWTAFTDFNVNRFNDLEVGLVNIQRLLNQPPAYGADLCKNGVRNSEQSKLDIHGVLEL